MVIDGYVGLPIEGNALSRARVIVADDHTGVLESVVRLLSKEFDVVGSVSDGRALLDAASLMQPDILILDISMPVVTGIEAAGILRKRGLTSKIVFLTVHEDPDFVRFAHDAGGLGYVVKQRMISDLPEAIRQALKGKRFTSPSLNSRSRPRNS